MQPIAMVDGQFVDIDKPVICIEDRGYQFGDAIYEVVPIMEGRLVGFDYHMERLDRSLREMKIPAVYTREEIYEFFVEIMQKGQIYDGNIYMQISRGVSPRLHQYPDKVIPVTVLVGKAKSYDAINEEFRNGMKLLSLPDIRWYRCDIKTVNLLGNVFAKQKAIESGFDDAVFYRTDTGHVTECSSSNFHVVKGGVVWTHPDSDLILPGCTKRIIIHDLCSKLDIPVVEKPYDLDFAKAADEAFMSASSYCGLPVVKIDKTLIGDGKPGPIAHKIHEEFKKYLAAQKVIIEKK
jgi:D-alanine transaminase